MSDFSLRRLAKVITYDSLGTAEMFAVAHPVHQPNKWPTNVFDVLERSHFIRGYESAFPRGILAEKTVPNSSHQNHYQALGYLVTGVRGNFSMFDGADCLLHLIHALPLSYRRQGAFVVSSDAATILRRMKSSNGYLIWESALMTGWPDTIFGYPVYESEDLPAMKKESFSIVFGDFFEGYLILDGPVRYTQPMEGGSITATKRVDGYVKNFNAIKLLKFAEE